MDSKLLSTRDRSVWRLFLEDPLAEVKGGVPGDLAELYPVGRSVKSSPMTKMVKSATSPKKCGKVGPY